MIAFLLNDANTVFNVAVCIIIVLGIVEGLAMLLGMSLIALFDSITSVDMDFEVDAEVTHGGLTGILGWIGLNKLPLMIWFVLFLACFSIVGYSSNYLMVSIFGVFLPPLVSSLIAFFIGITITGRIGKRLAHYMPKNESSAISTDTFSGRVATITSGTARLGSPTEASFVDNFKQKHYVLVEPQDAVQEFHVGESVVLLEKRSSSWLATKLN